MMEACTRMGSEGGGDQGWSDLGYIGDLGLFVHFSLLQDSQPTVLSVL